MKTWQILIFVTFVRHIFAVSSGVYIDNGRNQTVMQRSISRSEMAQFEEGLLALLGLLDKPSRKAIRIDLSASAPKFMLNLYNLMDGSDDKVDNDFVLTKSDYRTVEESDSIMTFSSENDMSRHPHENRKRLWFNVSSAPVGDTVIGAELRLFRDANECALNYGHQLDITVTMFQVVKNLKGEKKRAFVDSKHVTSDFNGWLVFNITSAFVSWVAFPSSNYGLDVFVSVQRPSESSDRLLPKEAGIIMTKYNEIDKNILPFVVAFFKSDGKPPRRSSTKPKNRSKQKTNEPQEIQSCERPYNWESMWLVQSCQIQSMYVDFKDLEWRDWVVAPQGYAAYFCSGECNFPLNFNMNATNHAIMQSLLHLLDPSRVPKPKCAPSQLGPMSLLYVLEDNSVTLTRFPNMVVKSCGCF